MPWAAHSYHDYLSGYVDVHATASSSVCKFMAAPKVKGFEAAAAKVRLTAQPVGKRVFQTVHWCESRLLAVKRLATWTKGPDFSSLVN